MSKRKSRTISLRLSDQEYEALKAMYTAHGARSISDFARTAMQRAISGSASPNVALDLKVQELHGKITVMDSELARLAQLFESEVSSRSRVDGDEK